MDNFQEFYRNTLIQIKCNRIQVALHLRNILNLKFQNNLFNFIFEINSSRIIKNA